MKNYCFFIIITNLFSQTSNAQIEDYLTVANEGSQGLVSNGNDLYIVQSGENKISKIDITQINPTITDVISGVNPFNLLFAGNNLYFSDNNSVKK